MADHEHQPDAARRMRDLLYVIRLTETLGENTMPEDFVGGYNQALDDITDAMQCGCEGADLDWIWPKRAERYPMNTEEQRPQAEDRMESTEVGRLISERNREDAEEYRNTMETMRQVAEEQRQTREHLREAARESARKTAEASTQYLLERMDRFEERLSQLAARLKSIEALLKSMQGLHPKG